jgi:hypothetical protein
VRDTILNLATHVESYMAYGFGVASHDILQSANKPIPSDLMELQKKIEPLQRGLILVNGQICQFLCKLEAILMTQEGVSWIGGERFL